MAGQAEQDEEMQGQDSFLDVVANLVGVLIILVMVVGTQARQALSAAKQKASEPPPAAAVAAAPAPDVAGAETNFVAAVNEINDIKSKTEREAFEVAYRKQERDRLQLMVSSAEAQINQAKSKLSTEARAEFEVSARMLSAFEQLADLDNALAGLSDNEKPTEVVKHYPTPMAKTVFGKEVHFRLQDSKLTYVPFEEFVVRLKEDAPQHMWKLQSTERITETIGPLHGFRMKYTLKKEVVAVPVSGGVAKGERASLEHFVLIPVNSNLGEPLEAALAPNSEFRTTLGQYNPKQFTVTLWVYPDSFQHFRRVRDVLLKQGFITAGRPMPDGQAIGGSPEGSRSAAQ